METARARILRGLIQLLKALGSDSQFSEEGRCPYRILCESWPGPFDSQRLHNSARMDFVVAHDLAREVIDRDEDAVTFATKVRLDDPDVPATVGLERRLHEPRPGLVVLVRP